MPVSERYSQQIALLVQTLPAVAEEKEFALKGGTAINLFVRNMPRLSVDIDLTFLPVMSRDESLAVERAQFPDNRSSVHAWVGREYDAFRTIRTHLRQVRGLKKHEHLAVSYWRRGEAQA